MRENHPINHFRIYYNVRPSGFDHMFIPGGDQFFERGVFTSGLITSDSSESLEGMFIKIDTDGGLSSGCSISFRVGVGSSSDNLSWTDIVEWDNAWSSYEFSADYSVFEGSYLRYELILERGDDTSVSPQIRSVEMVRD